jgi:hypothetical protein
MIIHLNSAITNVSLQVGDRAYYSVTSTYGNFETSSNINFIGTITEIGNSHIRVDNNATIPQNAFIMFSKNNAVNISSLKGYFAEVTMQNFSSIDTELFAISSEVDESSK